MLPSIRRSIKTDVSKNRSLKDILSPTASALEIISVEELDYHVYNTKAVVLVEENGIQEERVLIYNRLAINELLSGVSIVSEEIEDIILDLNELGFDFTEDDLELVENKLQAKVTSIGYIGKHNQSLSGGAEILCEGALPSSEIYLTGRWDVEVDGEILGSNLTKDEVFRLINPFQNDL